MSDDVWRAFRQAIGDRSVSEVLAGYVEREVAAALAKDGPVSDRQLLDALDRALELQRAVERLVARLGSRVPYLPPVREDR